MVLLCPCTVIRRSTILVPPDMMSSAPPASLGLDSSSTGLLWLAGYYGTRVVACLCLVVLLPVILVSCVTLCLYTSLLCCCRCKVVPTEEDQLSSVRRSTLEVIWQLPATQTTDCMDVTPPSVPRLYDGLPISEPCSICLDELWQRIGTVQQLRCGHSFHCNCIGQWLANNRRCPLCLQHVATAIDVRRTSGAQQSESGKAVDPTTSGEATETLTLGAE